MNRRGRRLAQFVIGKSFLQDTGNDAVPHLSDALCGYPATNVQVINYNNSNVDF